VTPQQRSYSSYNIIFALSEEPRACWVGTLRILSVPYVSVASTVMSISRGKETTLSHLETSTGAHTTRYRSLSLCDLIPTVQRTQW
jgi:hypothetical protein